MNLHPLVVHFPIALLSVYTLLEVYRWWRPSHGNKLVITKLLLLVIGVIGGRVAAVTGELVEDLLKRSEWERIVEAHESAANISITLYTILLVVTILIVAENYVRHRLPPYYYRYYERLIKIHNRAEVFHIWQVIAIIAL